MSFQSLLRRFIKRDALDVTPYKLVRLDVTDQKLWIGPKDVNIGMGAAAALKVRHPAYSYLLVQQLNYKM